MTLNELEHIAQEHLAAHRDEAAYQTLVAILQRDPQYAHAYYLLSLISHKYKHYDKEVELLGKALSLEPYNLRYTIYYASAKALVGDKGDAYRLLQNISLASCDAMDLVDTIATTYNRLLLYREACGAYEYLVNMGSASPFSWFNLGTCYKYIGEFSKSREALVHAISIKPDFYKAHAALAALENGLTGLGERAHNRPAIQIEHAYTSDPDDKHHDQTLNKNVKTFSDSASQKNLQQLLAETNSIDNKLYIAHALSKELDQQARYDEAFTVLKDTKGLKRSQLQVDTHEPQVLFDKLEIQLKNLKHRSNKPPAVIKDIFVVGMPRSGTTLLERIISGLEDVNSGGELYQFGDAVKKHTNNRQSQFILPDSLAQQDRSILHKIHDGYYANVDYLRSRKILTNKLPVNFLYAPQIFEALPNAVMVCMDRHPMDTILGNYRQLFNFDDGIYRYTLDLNDCAHFYVRFRNWIQKLSEAYPHRFYIVNYHNLVLNPEDEIKPLMDFCQLPWDPSCLDIGKNLQPVASASSVQVRDAIHSRSIGHWEHYKHLLTPVQAILRDANIEF